MRVGILTFHSQLNYGGVLQAYALQETLRGLGHDVIVLDRWLDPENRALTLGRDRMGFWGWTKLLLRSILGGDEIAKGVRVKRTRRFLRESMHLSEYSFYSWKDVPSDLGVDVIVVGSDQVWRTGRYAYPGVYLLEGAPDVPAVAYAASFGMKTIPDEYKSRYRKGLKRFKAISCRESSGVALCEDLGFRAAHVVDPTLLLPSEHWRMFAGNCAHGTRKKIICYFMDGDVPAILRKIEQFATVHDVDVEVFLDSRFCTSLPKSFAQLVGRLRPKRTKFRTDAGPVEFVRAFSSADAVITDSFHALMFSVIFGCNVRFLRPECEYRRDMFSRVEEFVRDGMSGKVIVGGIGEALESITAGERVQFNVEFIAERRKTSLEWLNASLDLI